jgi:tRNA-dihydrouridine synthase
MLFSVCDVSQKFISSYEQLREYADLLGIEVVPLIYRGSVKTAQEVFSMIEKESVLGGAQMEGVVVKNYQRPFLLGGQPIPVMAGKYVSEKFKEVHRKSWGSGQTVRGRYEVFKDSFRMEARWLKATQHLLEAGKLVKSPRDIGNLIKEISSDIEAEEKENIKEFLWKEFGGEVLRAATKGAAEWYKEKLLKDSLESENG